MTKKYIAISLIFIVFFIIFFSIKPVAGFSLTNIKLFFTGNVVSDVCSANSYATIEVGDPNDITLDNAAYLIKNVNSDNVGIFKNNGNLYLKGICAFSPNCDVISDSFVVKNDLGEIVSFINASGDLCIESGDCSDLSATCNPTNNAFLIKDINGNNIIYLDNTGDLCLIGNLYQQSGFAKQYLLKLLELVNHDNKVVKIESISNDNKVVVSVDGTSSNLLTIGSSEQVNGLNIKNVGTSCIRCGDNICSTGEDINNCPEDCTGVVSICGNSILETGEQCDDGNLVNGDGCSSTCQTTAQCNDLIDNDQDTKTDLADPGCVDSSDNDETDPSTTPQCSDGIDNDGDGKVDYPQDPGCVAAGDTDETDMGPGATQCSDGIDNDGDGKIDLADNGCSDSNDNDETDLPSGGGGDTGGGSTSCIKRYSKISGGLIDYYPTCGNTKVTRILFKLKETQRDVTVKVKKASLSSSIPSPDGIVYQYFQIEFNLDKDKFASSKIEFEVNNDWISRNGFTSDNIRLIKYDGAWIDLTTTKISQTSTKTLYETPDAKGFSLFAIVGRTTPTQPINKCGNGVMNAGEDCKNCPADVRCKADEYCNLGVCTKKPVEPVNLCDNNIIDIGEDCRNCPADVRCGSDEYCNNGICAKVQPPVKKFNIKDYIVVLIIGILIVIGLIISIIIYLRANRKTGEYKLKTAGNKKVEELKKLVEDLRSQGYSKDQIRISALRANWPKGMVDEVLKNIK